MQGRWAAALLLIAVPAIAQQVYRVRAGESVAVNAAQGARGHNAAGIVIGPSATGDRILAGVALNTPPGDYDVAVSAPAGETQTVHLRVDPLPRAAAGDPPVILLNGWQFSTTGGCPPSSGPSDSFGALPGLLTAAGTNVYFFDNCVEGQGNAIEALGNRLGEFIAALRDSAGASVTQVDLVAHSMGGLIARAYLAGLQPDGSLRPPSPTKVRKLIQIATPNFGSYLADVNRNNAAVNAQGAQMIPGSNFLWRLATWNQRGDDLRGVDALAIAGNRGTAAPSGTPAAGAGDGVVSLTSAALGFSREASRTRVLNYCHVDSSGLIQLFVNCGGPGVAKAAETHNIVRSFLDGTDAWRTIGTSADQNPVLSQSGGIYVGAAGADAAPVTDLTAATFGATALSPGGAASTVFYREFVSGTETMRYTSTQRGNRECGARNPRPGSFTVVRCKEGADIAAVGPLVAGSSARVVESGGAVTIAGTNIGPICAGQCSVTASPGNVPLAVESSTANEVRATLPGTFAGLTTIRVALAASADTITFMAGPSAAGGQPVITSVVHGGTFQPGIQNNSWITIRGMNLAPTARTWNPRTEIVNGVLPTVLDGVSVTVNGKPAALAYISQGQINALAPADTALGPVAVVVATAQGMSSPFQATLQAYSPGLFVFEPRGGRYPAATHADGSLLGPADLYGGAVEFAGAKPGETIVLYGTGFGPTDSPVPSDRVFSGAAILTGAITVTIGGQPARVLFQGVTSNGLCQLNIEVPDLPDGDHAVAITAGGVASTQNVFLAVKR